MDNFFFKWQNDWIFILAWVLFWLLLLLFILSLTRIVHGHTWIYNFHAALVLFCHHSHHLFMIRFFWLLVPPQFDTVRFDVMNIEWLRRQDERASLIQNTVPTLEMHLFSKVQHFRYLFQMNCLLWCAHTESFCNIIKTYCQWASACC